VTERRYELVVYGATGYTGRQAIAYLAPRAGLLNLRWAIAGRDERRLAELAAALPDPQPSVMVADASDAAALTSLASETSAVVNYAGPQGPLGDLLTRKCAAAGTHYADLCGENDVIADRVDKLHRPAQKAGVKSIPACGYEAVPFDLGALGLDRAFFGSDGSRLEEVDAKVRFHFHRSPLRHGSPVSGGTLSTMTRLVEAGDLSDTHRLARAAGAPEKAGGGRKLQLDARRSPDGSWLAPLAPVPFLNPAIVHLTSARLADDMDIGAYSPALDYQEALEVSATFGSSLIARPAAKGMSAVLRRLAAMSTGRRNLGDRATLAILATFGPKAGKGPPLSSLDAIEYRIDLCGRSSSGLTATANVHGVGDPGYRSAPNILAEAGIALARDSSLPERSGVLTPASGLGMEFIDSLVHAGLNFDFGTPVPASGPAMEALSGDVE